MAAVAAQAPDNMHEVPIVGTLPLLIRSMNKGQFSLGMNPKKPVAKVLI